MIISKSASGIATRFFLCGLPSSVQVTSKGARSLKLAPLGCLDLDCILNLAWAPGLRQRVRDMGLPGPAICVDSVRGAVDGEKHGFFCDTRSGSNKARDYCILVGGSNMESSCS